MDINIYEFDQTIYDGISSLDFYWFCLLNNPLKVICYLPVQIKGFFLYLFCKNKEGISRISFFFLNGLDSTEDLVKDFWVKKQKNIKDWYLKMKSENDIIVSSSPHFLLKPICDNLGIKMLIASNVSIDNGKFSGENCYGIEKIHRFQRYFKDYRIINFYSHFLSDTPLAKIAQNSYIVKRDKIIEWDKYKPSNISMLFTTFLNREFILFILCGIINVFNGILFSCLFSFIINENLSFILGYLLSHLVSYFLNSFFVFEKTLSVKKYIKFFISYIPNFLIQNMIVILIFNILNMNKLIAYVLAAILGVPITFVLTKTYTFNNDN